MGHHDIVAVVEISDLLQTGLNRDALEAVVGLCEAGINPEAIAQAVVQLQTAADELRAAGSSS